MVHSAVLQDNPATSRSTVLTGLQLLELLHGGTRSHRVVSHSGCLLVVQMALRPILWMSLLLSGVLSLSSRAQLSLTDTQSAIRSCDCSRRRADRSRLRESPSSLVFHIESLWFLHSLPGDVRWRGQYAADSAASRWPDAGDDLTSGHRADDCWHLALRTQHGLHLRVSLLASRVLVN